MVFGINIRFISEDKQKSAFLRENRNDFFNTVGFDIQLNFFHAPFGHGMLGSFTIASCANRLL